MDFVHLHVHSHYSLLTGLTKIKQLVKAAKKRGFKAISLTDYGSMYGAIEFYKACEAEEIKPIIGFEAFVAPRSMEDKDPQVDKEVHHLVLLAENYEGYRNLMKLSSIGHLEGFFDGKPRIDKEVLKKYSKHVIALSGCIHGEIPQLLKAGDIKKAQEVVEEYNDIFGQDNFYLELQDHPAIEGQMDVNTKLIQLSSDTGIPMIVSRDVHYLDPDLAEAQDTLTCIRDGRKVHETDREDYRHVDRSLNSAEDIYSRFKHVKEGIDNTKKIADRINVKLELDNWHFAPVDLPEGKNADEHLRDMVFDHVSDFYDPLSDEVKERIEYELGIIKEKGYSPYFICVADYVRYAKERGIIETTRGSAAGSVVSYVIGITTVDPIRFKLPFERFLNPFRPSPPDIDTDFADDRREEMIEFVTEKYGADKVAQIITFGTMAARASVRDVGRALGLSYGFCDQVAKLIPVGAQGFPMTIDRALNEEPDLKKLYETNDDVKRLLNLARQVEGCARHTSIHAAGVVISPTPLTDFTPVQREVGGEKLTTQYEMKSVESAGVLKMDFLGIRNLSILGRAVEIVEKTTGDKIDVYTLPLDDSKTFEMLSEGKTMGTFQLSGSGMTRWIKELKPSSIDDIMAMVALYRPGPMDVIPEYIRRQHNPELTEYLDPRMEKYLDASFGLLVYQDDVLLTAIELAGYDWMEADKFRKAIGKKIPEEMEKQKIKFFQGCRDHGGLKEDKIKILWELIEPFAAYGFNKCLHGDTQIVDSASGRIVSIRELYEKKKKAEVYSVDSRHSLKRKKVPRIYSNGRKEVWKLRTRSGRQIIATSNHRFKRFSEWVELENLNVGDLIATPRVIPHSSQKSVDPKRVRAIGYLIAEGNLCHPHGVYFYSKSEREISDYISCVQSFSNTKVTINRSKPATSVYVGKKDSKKNNGLMTFLDKHSMLGKNALNKEIPAFVFELSQDNIAQLIGAMWQGDGCVHDDKYGQIFYATSSEKLSQQLQHLLLRIGILSTIHKKKFKYRGKYKKGYTIHVSRYNNIKLFKDFIGPYLLSDKHDALKSIIAKNKILSNAISARSARGTVDIIPQDILQTIREEMKKENIGPKQLAHQAGIAERLLYFDKRRKGYLRETIETIALTLDSDILHKHASSDIFWDQVKEISFEGSADTYDLTVPKDHNFVANDIIVHNSHAASYGIVAYQTSYMKAHYPVQYMTAVLQAEAADSDKVAAIVHECSRMDIEVLPPDVNESFRNFAMVSKPGEPGRIRFGLTAIKNVGEHICEVIYRERKDNGQYKDLEDFLTRVQDKDLNKKSLEALIATGAMDCFSIDRGLLMSNIENILGFVRQVKERSTSNQDSLFAGTSIALDDKVVLKDAPDASMDQKLAWEKNLLGLYVSSHPFATYEKVLRDALIPLSEIETYPRDEWACVGGVVEKVTKKITKKGSIMLFVTVADQSGSMEVLVFPKMYERTQGQWNEGEILALVCKTPKEQGDNKLFAEKLYRLTKENCEEVSRYLQMGSSTVSTPKSNDVLPWVTLSLSAEYLKEKAEDIKYICDRHPGKHELYVKVGANTIKGKSKIAWNDEIKNELSELVGMENISVTT